MSRRLFVRNKEVNFFNVIGKELIQDIVGQKVIYYAISEKLTKQDDLYGESVNKTTCIPVEINALVLYNDPSQTTSKFSFDTVYSINVYFLINELLERGIKPREGDFVQYGANFYEIEQLARVQQTYGRIENQISVQATCRIARKSQLNIPLTEKAT